MCDQMAATCHDGVPHVHAMAYDDAGGGSGGLLALGLNASNGLKPFAFTVDTVRFALSAGGLIIHIASLARLPNLWGHLRRYGVQWNPASAPRWPSRHASSHDSTLCSPSPTASRRGTQSDAPCTGSR